MIEKIYHVFGKKLKLRRLCSLIECISGNCYTDGGEGHVKLKTGIMQNNKSNCIQPLICFPNLQTSIRCT